MISNDQLEIWAKPGAKTTAKQTCDAVRAALEASPALMARDPDIFLQGSYRNATNIRGDSDVDIVCMLGTQWIAGLDRLSPTEVQRYRDATVDATYGHTQFVTDVEAALVAAFGRAAVTVKNKCIKIEGNGHRLDADVVPAHQYREYVSVPNYPRATYIEGVQIRPRSGGSILNFPKHHIANGQDKNQQTDGRYKDTVRQYKNMLAEAVRDNVLDAGQVPGYFTECLLSNVPDRLLSSADHAHRVIDVLEWVAQIDDLGALTSADGIHELFRTDPGKWNGGHVTALLDGVIKVLR